MGFELQCLSSLDQWVVSFLVFRLPRAFFPSRNDLIDADHCYNSPGRGAHFGRKVKSMQFGSRTSVGAQENGLDSISESRPVPSGSAGRQSSESEC